MALGIDLGIIGTGLAAGGFFLGLGWKADDLISKQARDDLAEYLSHFKEHKTIKTVNLWPRIFREFFDTVFGEKHLSFRCFFRSSIASLISLCICIALVTLIVANSLSEGESLKVLILYKGSDHPALETILTLLVLFGFFNFVTDYLSLLETRFVIARIEKTKSIKNQLGWVVLDFFATGAIFFLIVSLVFIVIASFEIGTNYQAYVEWGLDTWDILFLVLKRLGTGLSEFFVVFPFTPLGNKSESLMNAYVWTTYFTSLWVWLYFLAQLATKLVYPLSRTTQFLKYLLPINSYPLRSVCTVMAIFASLGTWIILIPRELFS